MSNIPLRYAAASIVVLALTAVLAKSQAKRGFPAPVDNLVTHTLYIVDKDNKQRCILTTDHSTGDPMIIMSDKTGQGIRLALSAHDDGQVVIKLATGGHGSATISVNPKTGPAIELLDHNGKGRFITADPHTSEVDR